jgi:hypothetical protein
MTKLRDVERRGRLALETVVIDDRAFVRDDLRHGVREVAARADVRLDHRDLAVRAGDEDVARMRPDAFAASDKQQMNEAVDDRTRRDLDARAVLHVRAVERDHGVAFPVSDRRVGGRCVFQAADAIDEASVDEDQLQRGASRHRCGRLDALQWTFIDAPVDLLQRREVRVAPRLLARGRPAELRERFRRALLQADISELRAHAAPDAEDTTSRSSIQS